MKWFNALFFIALFASCCASEKCFNTNTGLSDQQVLDAFRVGYDGYTTDLYKNVVPLGDYFIVLSPQAIWLSMAAIAEGSEPKVQEKLFNLLRLPKDQAIREKFYKIATSRIQPNNYVNVAHSRALVIDDSCKLNQDWFNLVRQNSLLQIVSAPMKKDPATTRGIIRQVMSRDIIHKINTKGNSVILNSMDYNGLWTSAFPGAVIQRSPFYNRVGERSGSVDLMRVKKRARVGYSPSIDSKMLELPLGVNGEYRMIFALIDTNSNIKKAIDVGLNNNTLFGVLESLEDTVTPIELGIPRLHIEAEIDMIEAMLRMGITDLWKDADLTRNISSPPAFPTAFIQRATLTLDTQGVFAPPPENYGPPHGSYDSFIVDRPFMFGLFDVETYTCLMATFYSKPTYPL